MNMLASRGQLRASFLRWALFVVPVVLLLGFLSGQVAGSGPGNIWFDYLEKPSTYPPPATFGIVWSILYVLIGLAVALVCAAWGARGRTAALVVFAVHFVLNLAWSPTFFAFHQISLAFGVIVGMIVTLLVVIWLFWKVRPLAGALLIPYLAWIVFAALLNWQFLQLNPEADGNEPYEAVQRYEI